jgi:Tol biopolymer transport system component
VATEKPSTLWKVPIDGGTPVRVSGQTTTWSGTPSPDGNLLACYVFLDGSEQPWKIGIMSVQGGEPFMLLDIPAFRGIVSWTADSKSLIYIKGITGELWQQPIDGRAATKLFDVTSERLYNFAFSPDFKKVAYSLGNEFREAVVISNFKTE